jgi:D-glycero-D-manno-heptose 1,7-bisphosphate phosphatase
MPAACEISRDHGRPLLVILDRDGVLNADRSDYVLTPDQLAPLPGAARAVARLNAAGCRVAVATNQSAIGRGLLTVAGLDAIHARLMSMLSAAGGHIDRFYFAPDHPDAATPWRKPGPGMLLEAMAAEGVAPAETLFVGDQPSDAAAAAAAGVRFLLVRTGKGRATEATLPAASRLAVVDDLAAAVDLILGEA